MQTTVIGNIRPIELKPLSEMPLVSILVPNYNYAKYIGVAIESILHQTYSNFEVIICDDGSKDNSCEIVEPYLEKDSRIKLIRKPNGGVASALNTAYREAKGEIISILDADDIWLDSKLQLTVNLFKSNNKSGFAIHNVIQVDGQGSLIKPTAMYSQLPIGWLGESALENGGFVYDIPPASALSIRREVAECIFPLNEQFVRNADSLIFRFAPFITEIISTNKVLSKFRIHGSNTTSVAIPTPEFLERELITLESVHKEQKKFLASFYNSFVAEKLTDINFSIVVCRARYLVSRLRCKSKIERQQVYNTLINHPKFQSENLFSPQKLLLQWGEYLPDPIFQAAFDQIYGLGKFKLLVRKFLSFINFQKYMGVAR